MGLTEELGNVQIDEHIHLRFQAVVIASQLPQPLAPSRVRLGISVQ